MKYTTTRRRLIRSVIAGICLLPFASNAANIVVGSGSDTSYLVLESGNLGVRTYEVRYNAADGPYDAKFLFDKALVGDMTLSASFTNSGSPSVPNFFVSSINGEAGSSSPPWTWWVHWVSGGLGFQNPNYSFNSGTPTPGSWSTGFGISAPYRLIAPGSWDALVFSDGSLLPSVSPIPEPSSLLVSSLGALLVFRRRRNR